MSADDEKSDTLALILSFFIPGLGQIYQGRVEIGAIFIVATLVSGFLIFFVIGFVLTPLVWAVNMYDVYTKKFEI